MVRQAKSAGGLVSVPDELDMLLYAWLSESEGRRAEWRFTSYFRAAFPAICRYLRSLRTDPATAQDIGQQALIKLFNHLGKGRKAADGRLREAITALRPLDFGALHVRQVSSWRSHVGSFRDAAIGFRVSAEPQSASGSWKELREEINDRIPPLARQGAHFMDEVRTRMEPRLSKSLSPDPSTGSPSNVSELQPGGREELESAHADTIDPAVERFLSRILEYAHARSIAEVDITLGCAGAVDFLTNTDAVRTSLPALAIPSNGLLYIIAKRQLLDRLRAAKSETARRIAEVADCTSDGVLEALDTAATSIRADSPHEATPWASALEAARDGSESDVEERYRAFLEFLRAPLTRAEGALAAAAATGKAKAEQARVDSLRSKYDRLMAVLKALREDPQPTEEQIAAREGLTRNQVKYVIERIREDFNYFFPDLARETQGRRKRQAAES